MDIAESIREQRELAGRGQASIPRLIWTLFRRSALDTMRNPSLTRAKLVQKVFMGIFLGLLYLNDGNSDSGIDQVSTCSA